MCPSYRPLLALLVGCVAVMGVPTHHRRASTGLAHGEHFVATDEERSTAGSSEEVVVPEDAVAVGDALIPATCEVCSMLLSIEDGDDSTIIAASNLLAESQESAKEGSRLGTAVLLKFADRFGSFFRGLGNRLASLARTRLTAPKKEGQREAGLDLARVEVSGADLVGTDSERSEGGPSFNVIASHCKFFLGGKGLPMAERERMVSHGLTSGQIREIENSLGGYSGGGYYKGRDSKGQPTSTSFQWTFQTGTPAATNQEAFAQKEIAQREAVRAKKEFEKIQLAQAPAREDKANLAKFWTLFSAGVTFDPHPDRLVEVSENARYAVSGNAVRWAKTCDQNSREVKFQIQVLDESGVATTPRYLKDVYFAVWNPQGEAGKFTNEVQEAGRRQQAREMKAEERKQETERLEKAKAAALTRAHAAEAARLADATRLEDLAKEKSLAEEKARKLEEVAARILRENQPLAMTVSNYLPMNGVTEVIHRDEQQRHRRRHRSGTGSGLKTKDRSDPQFIREVQRFNEMSNGVPIPERDEDVPDMRQVLSAQEKVHEALAQKVEEVRRRKHQAGEKFDEFLDEGSKERRDLANRAGNAMNSHREARNERLRLSDERKEEADKQESARVRSERAQAARDDALQEEVIRRAFERKTSGLQPDAITMAMSKEQMNRATRRGHRGHASARPEYAQLTDDLSANVGRNPEENLKVRNWLTDVLSHEKA